MAGFGATTFTLGPEPDPSIRLRNFHPPEDGFAWTAGRWGEVEFSLDLPPGGAPPAGALFTLDLDVLRCPPELEGQDLYVYLNGWRAASARVAGRCVVSFRARPQLLEAAGNVLTLQVPEAACPARFGRADGRLLGVQLFSMAVEAEAAAEAGPRAAAAQGRAPGGDRKAPVGRGNGTGAPQG